jgi:hypothetical protein
MQFRLRTLLIVLAVGPPLVAGAWWKYSAWRAEQAQQKAAEAEFARVLEQTSLAFQKASPDEN